MVWGRVIGLAVLVLFLSRAPLLGQELRGGGEIRSSSPATSEASKKIVSRLRGLIADFRTQGISSENAGDMGVAGRFSSPFLKVDPGGRVQVEVTVTDTSEASLDALRAHGLDIEIVNR